jgi:hypothetical protein
MPYTLLRGSFVIRYPDLPRQGPEPDGDTIKFRPDTPALVEALPRRSGVPPDINARGISARLEAIDTLETHFQETHQELAGANAARDELLRRLGFTNVRFFDDLPNAVRAARSALARDHQASPRARACERPPRAGRHPSSRLDRPHHSHQRAEEPHHRCSRAPAGQPARPATGPAAGPHRGNAHRSCRHHRAPQHHPDLPSITARIRLLAAQLAELEPELTQLVTQHPAGPLSSPSPASDLSWPPSC